MMSLITPTTTHTERVRSELKESGVSSMALHRFTARYLPKIIHENEHIEAAVFGRHKESEGLFGFAEGILVATTMRVIYLDHRPGYTTMDEVAYDVVSGVNVSTIGLHSSITLFTKIANYTVSFAKLVCVRRFADYILHDTIIEPDTSYPFSHLITGIVLRAFAAHKMYRRSPEAIKAGELLAGRFFQKDIYTDLSSPKAWLTFSYPFWNTDLISSLDILSKLGFDKDDDAIQKAIAWLAKRQQPNGLFNLHKNHDRYHDQDLWLALAICRIMKRFG